MDADTDTKENTIDTVLKEIQEEIKNLESNKPNNWNHKHLTECITKRIGVEKYQDVKKDLDGILKANRKSNNDNAYCELCSLKFVIRYKELRYERSYWKRERLHPKCETFFNLCSDSCYSTYYSLLDKDLGFLRRSRFN